MSYIVGAIEYVLSFEVYVMLPILMIFLCLIIGMKFLEALKNAMTLGIGFLGIFMVFNFFVAQLGPAIEAIAERTGSTTSVMDAGWTALATSAWSYEWVPIILLIGIVVNGLFLVLKWTETVNIDIWNYWHFIFSAQLIHFITGSLLLGLTASVFSMIFALKMGDYSAKKTEEMSSLPGIAITTITAVAYYPIAVFFNWLIERVPFLAKVDGHPGHIQEKLGFVGDPRFMGFVMGCGIGWAAGYEVKDMLQLAMSVAGVVFILPKMSAILGEGLLPISTHAKAFILGKFPGMKHARIGMDLAVLIGMPECVVTGILLMPVAVVAALVLPGIDFIPLGDLPVIIAATVLVVVATKGNIFRSFIIMVPVVIGKLYIASWLAPSFTTIASKSGVALDGYSGMITSLQDGGNFFRAYLFYLFQGNWIAILLLPAVLGLMWYTRKVALKEN